MLNKIHVSVPVLLRRRHVLLLLALLLFQFSSVAQRLQIGQSYKLSVYPPDGWITSASWSCSNPAIGIDDYGDGVCLVYPVQYFQGTATVECFFTYSYQTYYSGRPHTMVGYQTKYFSISCVAPSVSITPSQTTVKPGEKVHLKVNVSPVSSSKYPRVVWSYSNTYVASTCYDSYYFSLDNGYREIDVETYNAGTCTVTADIGGGLSASCEITVKNEEPTRISVSPPTATLAINETKQLSYSLTPSDASTSVTWSSSATSVATVSSSGLVTAKSSGTARITATTDNGLTASCDVTVCKPVPSSIKLSQSSLKLPVGDTKKLTYSVTPSNAIYTATWSSDATAVATVNSSGTVTAVAPGTARIKVLTDNGVSDQCVVTVPPLPESISIPTDITVGLNKNYQLSCVVSPQNAVAAYSWGSSDVKVAGVDQNGLVNARKVGTAVITVKSSNGLTASCQVTVPEPQYALVVWTNDGERSEYAFAEKPQVTMHNDYFTVSSLTTTVEYAAKDILRFTLEDKGILTGLDGVRIQEVNKAVIHLAPDHLLVSGCRPGSAVTIYSINGQIIESRKVDADGQQTFSLTSYVAGIYIIKTETINFKIIKR